MNQNHYYSSQCSMIITSPSLLYLIVFFFITPHLMVFSQLDYNYYGQSCPNLNRIVRRTIWSAVTNDTRMAASLLRLHFHDCFVNGCEGSVLLDDTNTLKGEKNAGANRNSARGFEIIDTIKANVEEACPSTVSCTDILTLAARDSVYLSGGSYYYVPLGRRDGKTASVDAANKQIPSPFESLENITAKFTSNGLDINDVVVLSGAHTIGYAQCFTFKHRLFNFQGTGKPDPLFDPLVLKDLQNQCPNQDGSNTKLSPLDSVTTYSFDNVYFKNLVNNSGLLQSDQALMSDSKSAALVNKYSQYPYLFNKDFGAAMVKLSKIGVIIGQDGEIRKNCRFVN